MMYQLKTSNKRSRTDSQELDEPVPKLHCVGIMSALPDRMVAADDAENDFSPQDNITRIVQSQGFNIRIQQSLDMKNFFVEYTKEELAAYDANVLTAIKSQDIKKLREFHSSGRPLKCSNRFGESLLHMACRRGFMDVVTFLIHEAHVPVRVRDDYGRTILRDAAWAAGEPNFKLITMILKACPDLLFMSDRRGHTPISYARRSHWGAWNSFLKENEHLVIQPVQE